MQTNVAFTVITPFFPMQENTPTDDEMRGLNYTTTQSFVRQASD
jgi:hypothetical protein